MFSSVKFEIDAFEVFGFFKSGGVVGGVAGGFLFRPAATGSLNGLADDIEKFGGGDVRRAGTSHQHTWTR